MSEASKRGRENSNSDESPTVKRTAPVPEGMVRVPVLPAKVIKLKHLFEDVSTLDDDEDDAHFSEKRR
ncbi:hypothetical protein CAEBREN_05260 [Caenorhabditis brenneri]|uniref:Uncharacterized protein n=1 Tax=Caenorhabditis brenneri TaxID=135651 RepID=G0NI37_CAEBE|nr:hypothetical protein CAEBREN_05260 [Caenorhabditis brenneri]